MTWSGALHRILRGQLWASFDVLQLFIHFTLFNYSLGYIVLIVLSWINWRCFNDWLTLIHLLGSINSTSSFSSSSTSPPLACSFLFYPISIVMSSSIIRSQEQHKVFVASVSISSISWFSSIFSPLLSPLLLILHLYHSLLLSSMRGTRGMIPSTLEYASVHPRGDCRLWMNKDWAQIRVRWFPTIRDLL